MRIRSFMCALALAAACGGDGDDGGIPPEVQPLVDYLVAETRGAANMFQHVPQALVLALLDPVAAAAEGITFAPTGTPNQYDYSIPIDGDGDGTADATATGTVTLNQPPVAGPNPGLAGTIDGALVMGDGSSVGGSIQFESTPQGLEVSGAVTLTDPVDGYTGTMIILAGEPMVVKASGDGAEANLCTASGQGSAYVTLQNGTVAGSSPFYFEATLEFLFAAAATSMTHIRYGENESSAVDYSNASVELGCESSISDWVGTFEMFWFCPPGGGDFETHTFTVTGPNTVQVSKLGTGQTTPTVFTATALPGNPHVLVGEFTEGDPLYTETFRYTLSPDGSFFTQDNDYVIIEGPFTGDGGPCYGTGYRQ